MSDQWNRLDMNQGGVITRRVLLDAGSLPRRQKNLQQLIKSRTLKNLIRYVAGTGGEPIYSLQAIFAGHARKNNDPQSDFHSDAFHSTAKAWYFLEDVPIDDGPFAYVPGSHLLTPERLDWEYQQSCKAAQLGHRHILNVQHPDTFPEQHAPSKTHRLGLGRQND